MLSKLYWGFYAAICVIGFVVLVLLMVYAYIAPFLYPE